MNAPQFIGDGPDLILEAVELELALQCRDPLEQDFETAVREALERIGGTLLFHMRIDDQDCQRVAAVNVGDADERQTVLVLLPSDGGPPRVEPAENAGTAVGGFAASYAGLMERIAPEAEAGG